MRPFWIAGSISVCLVLTVVLVSMWVKSSDKAISTEKQAQVAETAEEIFLPQRLFPTHFPPITEFEVVSAEDADPKIAEDELVLGVIINDEARAYPINMISGPNREFVNDTLGGLPISPAW